MYLNCILHWISTWRYMDTLICIHEWFLVVQVMKWQQSVWNMTLLKRGLSFFVGRVPSAQTCKWYNIHPGGHSHCNSPSEWFQSPLLYASEQAYYLLNDHRTTTVIILHCTYTRTVSVFIWWSVTFSCATTVNGDTSCLILRSGGFVCHWV